MIPIFVATTRLEQQKHQLQLWFFPVKTHGTKPMQISRGLDSARRKIPDAPASPWACESGSPDHDLSYGNTRNDQEFMWPTQQQTIPLSEMGSVSQSHGSTWNLSPTRWGQWLTCQQEMDRLWWLQRAHKFKGFSFLCFRYFPILVKQPLSPIVSKKSSWNSRRSDSPALELD